MCHVTRHDPTVGTRSGLRRPPDRRAFLFALAAILGGASTRTTAQRPGRVPRIALLLPDDIPLEAPFRDALRELGYVDGTNVAIERQSAGGDFSRLPTLAAELARRKPDVIVSFVTQASIAARAATATIPVVFVGVSDPVSSGLVADLARPGGNVTGTGGHVSAVIGKQLELIRELKPGAARVGTLWNPTNAVFQRQMTDEARAVAGKLGVSLSFVEVRTAAELPRAVATLAAGHVDAVLVLAEPLFVANARHLGELLARHRLAAVGGSRANAEAGALASYGPDLAQSSRRAAAYVDRILRGARPADLPVEFTAKFELVVNLRTAAALGVAIAPAVLARADDVIR